MPPDRAGMVEVGGAAALADHPPGQETRVLAVDGAPDPLRALLVDAEPGQRHQRESVDGEDGWEPAVDGGKLFGHDQRVDDARATAAVFLGEERRGEAERVGRFDNRFHGDERLLRIDERIGPFRGRSQDFAREFARVVLQLPLSGCHLEVDRHRALFSSGS
jgi:hypothetical protein